MDGVLLSRDVVAGEVVDTGKVLFVIVDPRQMLLTLHVSADDVRFARLGAEVIFTPDGQREKFHGRISWIGTAADESTRSVPVRVEMPNTDGRLRASTLGTGRIILREEPNAVLVPSDAVHELAGSKVVFVRQKNFFADDGPKEFIVRTVRTGIREGANTEIIVGVQPEEVVASKGSDLLVNELKKTHVGQR